MADCGSRSVVCVAEEQQVRDMMSFACMGSVSLRTSTPKPEVSGSERRYARNEGEEILLKTPQRGDGLYFLLVTQSDTLSDLSAAQHCRHVKCFRLWVASNGRP